LGFIPKETGKNALIVIVGLLGLVFIYWAFKRKFKE
jgi:LPXTG-motif cell wall-anchored protein